MNNNIKFISYTGEYPNLCSGVLTIEVEGKVFELNRILSSGGCVSFDKNYKETVKRDPWCFSFNLPLEIESYEKEILDVINANIKWDCCGGCV